MYSSYNMHSIILKVCVKAWSSHSTVCMLRLYRPAPQFLLPPPPFPFFHMPHLPFSLRLSLPFASCGGGGKKEKKGKRAINGAGKMGNNESGEGRTEEMERNSPHISSKGTGTLNAYAHFWRIPPHAAAAQKRGGGSIQLLFLSLLRLGLASSVSSVRVCVLPPSCSAAAM